MYATLRSAARPIAKADITVCLIFKDCKIQSEDRALDKAYGSVLSAAAKRPECKGELGEITPVHAESRRFLLLGLGEAEKFHAQKLRAAAGFLARTLHRMDAASVHVSLNAAATGNVPPALFGRALGEGLGLGAFKFDGFKKGSSKKKTLQISVSDKTANAAVASGLALAEAANFARQLQATPPNVATTNFIAAQAKELARSLPNVSCTVIAGPALQRNKLVGLITVGKASEYPPCLIQLTYTPRGKAKGTVLLVGKTICYDTGGLSIKPREGMRGMKYDKSGGMAVLGAMQAISRIKPSCRVIALLPTAENSIARDAYRVDDIIKYPNGKTVEITNTDAEGRLVLADGLIYGCKKFKPDAVIDLATLTGGVVVALGSNCAGYWCDDEKLRGKLEAAAAETGESIWRLPLNDDYKDMMKAKHADLWNSAPVRDAHPIQGAAFLSYFVDEKIPWAHIDIAGTADIHKDIAPFVPGPTGFGVRLLAALLEKW